MGNIVVTGANGFVGRALCRQLVHQGHAVTGLVRKPGGCVEGVAEWLHRGEDYAGLADAWPDRLRADCIVHLGARVHVMRDAAADPETAFSATNVDGTLRVAQAARRHRVPRLVFASSIKAIAETDCGHPLRETDTPAPQDAYGRSKLAAEQALRRLGDAGDLDVVIVRPPLVYGPNVRANFLRMMDAVHRGVPLPLGAVRARRSLVYVENLADALVRCALDPRAARQCFHVADDVTPTVRELLEAVGAALQHPPRLIPVPPAWLRAGARLAGRSAQIERLSGNLRVDASHLARTLGWRPPVSQHDAIGETGRWYLSTR